MYKLTVRRPLTRGPLKILMNIAYVRVIPPENASRVERFGDPPLCMVKTYPLEFNRGLGLVRSLIQGPTHVNSKSPRLRRIQEMIRIWEVPVAASVQFGPCGQFALRPTRSKSFGPSRFLFLRGAKFRRTKETLEFLDPGILDTRTLTVQHIRILRVCMPKHPESHNAISGFPVFREKCTP